MKVFMSYRRDDSAPSTGRIYDRLVSAFGKDAIFRDVDEIPYGEDFPSYIAETLQQCSVLLAIIGRVWLTATTSLGERRLDDPEDYVRLEIESAFRLGITIIPVLLDDATMPREDELPPSLRGLTKLQAARVRNDRDFNGDVLRLLHDLAPKTRPRLRIGSIRTERILVGVAAVLLLVSCVAAMESPGLFRLPVGGDIGESTSTPPLAGEVAPDAQIGIDWSVTHPGFVSLKFSGFPDGSYSLVCTVSRKNGVPSGREFRVNVAADPDVIDNGRTCYDKQGGDQVYVSYLPSGSTDMVFYSRPLAVGAVPDPLEPYGTASSEALPTSTRGTSTVPSVTVTPQLPIWYETAGSLGSSTFSNYLDAGGTIGPRVSAFTTVQVSCKVTGFVTADGNPWWYRLSSGPWNNVLYAPADNFYNNGVTSGSLLSTPFVDTDVPNC